MCYVKHLTSCANLWNFFNGYYRPPLPTTSRGVKLEFQHLSETAFAVLNRNLADSVQESIMRFLDSKEPAYDAWQYLELTYRSRDFTSQITLEDEMSSLRMEKGERAENYLNRANAIRDELRAVGLPMSEQYCLLLLRGLPETGKWGLFRSFYQFNTHLEEEELIIKFHHE